jgi:hypothetical protein
MSKLFAVALLPALALAGAAQAQNATPAPKGESTSIPFITRGSVRTFESAPGGEGVYIQNNQRDWYYVSFFARCQNLPFAIRIGFDTFGNGSSLERGDTIFADRERCKINDIVRSGPPPKKVKKPKKG